MRPEDFILRAILKEGEIAPLGVMVALNIFVEKHVPDDPLAIAKVLEAYRNLLEYIPEAYRISFDELKQGADAGYQEPALSVPLYDILTNTGEAILNFCGPFCHKAVREAGLFEELRTQMYANENAVSGITNIDRVLGRKDVIGVNEYDAEPAELIRLYLRHTPFYEFFNTRIAFGIRPDRWPTHAVILAPSEWGKSELTGTFFREAIEDTNKRAVILCDPHGDLYNKAIQRVPPERLVAIDLTSNPPDLNILDRTVMSDRSALEAFRFLISSLAQGLTPKQQTCIKPLFALLQNIEDANLITLYEIISEPAKKPTKFAEPISRLDSIHRSFFEGLWYTGNFSETREALMWKVMAAIDDPTFNKMFSAKRNSINVSRWIEERKIVLIKSGDQLDKEGTRLFFLFLVGQYYAAARRRDAIPAHKRHLAMMFVDEASVVMSSPIISDLLVEIRKYNCAFIAATQLWQHIAQEVRPAVLGSTGIRILGQLGHDEASALYRDMKVPLETITGLDNVPGQYAQWCFFVRSVTQTGIVVKAPYGTLEALPKYPQKTGRDPPLSRSSIEPDDLAERVRREIREDKELPEEFEREIKTETLEAPKKGVSRAAVHLVAKADTTTELEGEAKASEATIKPGKDWSEPHS